MSDPAAEKDAPGRVLMTEPHDGHPSTEVCPGCPHGTAEKDAPPCVACGGDSNDGPVASNGEHWCGECAREAVSQS